MDKITAIGTDNVFAGRPYNQQRFIETVVFAVGKSREVDNPVLKN